MIEPEYHNLKSQTVGLRVSSVIFGLVCLVHIALLMVRPEIVIGSRHLGRIAGFAAIIITGGLCIWLAKLAGPWCAETDEVPTTKI